MVEDGTVCSLKPENDDETISGGKRHDRILLRLAIQLILIPL